MTKSYSSRDVYLGNVKKTWDNLSKKYEKCQMIKQSNIVLKMVKLLNSKTKYYMNIEFSQEENPRHRSN